MELRQKFVDFKYHVLCALVACCVFGEISMSLVSSRVIGLKFMDRLILEQIPVSIVNNRLQSLHNFFKLDYSFLVLV